LGTVAYIPGDDEEGKRRVVDYVLSRNISVDEFIVDSEKREGFRRLWDSVRKGGVSRVVVPGLRALPANVPTTLRFLADCSVLGVAVESVEEPWLSSVLGDERIRGLFKALKSVESRVVSERARAGVEEARRSGKRVGRPPKVTADQILRMIELRRRGASAREIARELGVSKTTVLRYLKKYPP
jgi:DNA invertase Pin-like site-specific DNA recombinase